VCPGIESEVLPSWRPYRHCVYWQPVEYLDCYHPWARASEKGLVWRVGNGTKIRVWRDSWIPRISYGKVLSSRRRSRIRWVSELLEGNGTWKEAIVRSTFLPVDADAILAIKPSRRGTDDVIAWMLEKSGVFLPVPHTNWVSLSFLHKPILLHLVHSREEMTYVGGIFGVPTFQRK
jgi:hypothetical protein